MIGPLALIALAYLMFMGLGIAIIRSTTVSHKSEAWRTFLKMQAMIAVIIVLGSIILYSINR